ncbi:MAG: Holliday junction branch migration protein RuvA [Synechococcaceae cyanobacterium RL_1_2]|nr:Holliday junction branch migration protein RuvA [Synechococcaceae cyanobacterium RL_1_2]
MINYLRGELVQLITLSNGRTFLIIEVNGMGYEVQITQRFASALGEQLHQPIKVSTHLQTREDQQILYGFSNQQERDLFRELVSVNGIGNQTAIALLDTLDLTSLVQAIVTSNIRMLSKTPGVGKKTAERLALELKAKLSSWRQQAGIKFDPGNATLSTALIEDVEMTLLALGYTNQEIDQALTTLQAQPELQTNQDPEEWIKRAIAWLSNF